MATYKVLQDIEAEDHILGPLTFRQFLYGLSSVFFFYLCFIAITKAIYLLLIFVLPPALFSGFLAFPFGRDQPTEVWALAKLRFIVKPKKRIWNQSGIKELVTITVPKHVEVRLTNGLSQTEVKDRLEALASTIDSRGWVVKNINNLAYATNDNERLINVSAIPQPVPDYEDDPQLDMLDEKNNPLAMNINQKIELATQEHHQQIIRSLSDQREQIVQPPIFSNESEAVLSSKLKAANSMSGLSTSNLHTISTNPKDNNRPTESTAQTKPRPKHTTSQPEQPAPKSITKQQTKTTNPDILKLANDNNLSVATIQHEANEVIINLH